MTQQQHQRMHVPSCDNANADHGTAYVESYGLVTAIGEFLCRACLVDLHANYYARFRVTVGTPLEAWLSECAVAMRAEMDEADREANSCAC